MKRCLGCFVLFKDFLEVCPYCGYIEGTPAAEAVHIEPGTVLAERYTVGKVLGYGGFGVTYIGWDSQLEHKVAIKEYLPGEYATRVPGQTQVTVSGGINRTCFDAGLEKFIDEAKRLSKFQHEDGIVKIFDCIAENDTAYIIMEYLDGETLAEKLRREGSIEESEALSIMMPVMRSLQEVHEAGIIHRDIAPDNIFITEDGRVKLIDFGAARYTAAEISRSLTVIVKPGYSPEEQYRSNSEQGPYTDVYAVAATLYKMLTGNTPPDVLERREKLETAKKDILTSPRKINGRISTVTENALLNALNIRIEDRTPDMGAFISDLTSDDPVKRVNGKTKRLNLYAVPMWIKIAVPSALAVIVIIAVLLATGVIDFKSLFKRSVDVPEGYTEVPDVEGMDVASAVDELLNSNLDYIAGGSVVSEYIDADLIVYQNPEAGRVIEENSMIELTVSRGDGEVVPPHDGISTVPAFLWREENEAVADLETAGLTVNVEYVVDEHVTEGQVAYAVNDTGSEVHMGDELPEGSVVVLCVSGEGAVSSSVTEVTEVGVNVLNIGDHSYACYFGCESWEQARDYCYSVGGHLAVISSQEENDAVYAFIRYCGYDHGYIGYSDVDQEGVWSWVDGDSSDYTNWTPGEPNAFTENENYAVITDNGFWNDGDFGPRDDSGIVCYVCEWNYILSGAANLSADEVNAAYEQMTLPAVLTPELAEQAFQNYFATCFPEETLAGIEAPCYWDSVPEQTTDEVYVYHLRSYTAAHIYYYMDMNTGLVRDAAYMYPDLLGFNDAVFNAWDYLPGMESNSVDPESYKMNESQVFEQVMAFIDDYEAAHPGSMYAYDTFSNQEVVGNTWGSVTRWILYINSSDGNNIAYAIDDYGMLPLDVSADSRIDFVSYDAIRSFPCYIETYEFNDESICFSHPNHIVQRSIADGSYDGHVIAVSADGTEVLMLLGRPYTVSAAVAESLQVGDQITVGDYNLQVISIDSYDGYPVPNFDRDCWLSPSYDGSYYTLLTSSDYSILTDCGYYLLHISESVDFADYYDVFGQDEVNAYMNNRGYTGNAIQDSAYWYYSIASDSAYATYNNGYYDADVYRSWASVSNNQITELSVSPM